MAVDRKVFKFGGSSLSSPESILQAKKIIQENLKEGDIVVVSAWGKTTDQLLDLWNYACQKDEKNLNLSLKKCEELYTTWLWALDLGFPLLELLKNDFINIKKILTQTQDDFLKHELLAYGEIWSSRHLASLLNASFLDARTFLKVKKRGGLEAGDIYYERSKNNFFDFYKKQFLNVIPGFIAQDEKGRTLNLGRDGSDYTATLIASFLDSNVTLWTDVSGIYSADPRICEDARPLSGLSVDESIELARCGTSILHPKTLSPLKGTTIKLWIKNTFSPLCAGTLISDHQSILSETKIINGKEDVCLLKVALPKDRSYLDILSLLDEHNIVPLRTKKIISENALEIVVSTEEQSNLLGNLIKGCTFIKGSLVSLIGESSTGEIQDFRTLLKKEKCSLLFFDERDKTKGPLAFFQGGDLKSLIRKLHQDLLKRKLTLGVALLGVGNVGKEWLKIFKGMKRGSGLDVKLLAVADSKKIYSDNGGIDPSACEALLKKGSQNRGQGSLMRHLGHIDASHVAIIDATASDVISDSYDNFFSKGYHIISANKKAGSSSLKNFKGLLKTAKMNRSQWLNNATVGAGLPINYTLKDLQRAGDDIESISGIFSGTLSWLFYHFDDSIPFSELLLKAKEQGITEPDPREDLSGSDVLRKLLILSREIGLQYGEEDVSYKEILSPSLISLSLGEFLKRSSLLDETFSKLYQEAKALGKVLRYVATVNKKEAKMGIVSVDPDHCFATINPGDNIFEIKSRWYKENALIIRGPGAGREVTAGAIQSDLMTLGQTIGL